ANVDDNDVGELTMGVMLSQLQWGNGKYMPAVMHIASPAGIAFQKPVKQAVEGWDGDRYPAWQEKATGKVVIVWTSVWDSEKDAQEFHDTYGDLLGKRVLGK